MSPVEKANRLTDVLDNLIRCGLYPSKAYHDIEDALVKIPLTEDERALVGAYADRVWNARRSHREP